LFDLLNPIPLGDSGDVILPISIKYLKYF